MVRAALARTLADWADRGEGDHADRARPEGDNATPRCRPNADLRSFRLKLVS
jgi:hypothetical protein